MKRILVICALLFSVTIVNAQRHGSFGHRGYYSRSHVNIGVGLGYNPLMPYYGYYPWYSYPPGYAYSVRPSRLSLKIEDIRADYQERIREARHNLKGKEKRTEIRRLKVERDHEIRETQMNYYNRSTSRY
ncbi:MAG TPA: hypothetical protein VFQ58_03130 [Flavisolibacter sp.]|nr:hypothetical protein [Flavisolibacter sp.]